MNTSPQTHFDVIVIGGGAVAENVADRIVQGGLTAVVVESELVGGDCSYWACMPSKALIRSGMALRAAKRLGGAKQAVSGELDVAAVLARRNSFTHDWNDQSQVDWLDKHRHRTRPRPRQAQRRQGGHGHRRRWCRDGAQRHATPWSSAPAQTRCSRTSTA